MSECCNISPQFSMNFFSRCNISRTFGFYNSLINRQKALKGVLSMSVLQTIDLKKYYGTEPNITRALDGVNFSVNDGEFVAVVGTSGSGKSTLLHMMGGLDTPTSGTVIVRGEELAKKKKMDAGKVFTRVMAGILAALMVLSVAGTLVYYIIML